MALLAFAGMIAVIATVLGFEHIGGYTPCKLCLGQREPYYMAIPVTGLALGAWCGSSSISRPTPASLRVLWRGSPRG